MRERMLAGHDQHRRSVRLPPSVSATVEPRRLHQGRATFPAWEKKAQHESRCNARARGPSFVKQASGRETPIGIEAPPLLCPYSHLDDDRV